MNRKTSGLTIIEMVLAMAIVAMIGLSVAGVTMALSTSQAMTNQSHDCMQTGRIAIDRLQDRLSKAKLITAVGDGVVIFWESDDDGDGLINIAELVEVRHHPDDDTLRLHRVSFEDVADATVAAALNESVALDAAADCSLAGSLIVGNAEHREYVQAEGVELFEVAAYPPCPEAKMVTLKLVISDGDQQTTFRSAVTLRADCTSNIGTSEGGWVLTGNGHGGGGS